MADVSERYEFPASFQGVRWFQRQFGVQFDWRSTEDGGIEVMREDKGFERLTGPIVVHLD
jgi:hypothetical protein